MDNKVIDINGQWESFREAIRATGDKKLEIIVNRIVGIKWEVAFDSVELVICCPERFSDRVEGEINNSKFRELFEQYFEFATVDFEFRDIEFKDDILFLCDYDV